MKKDLKIETMRIIACIMVILTHVSSTGILGYKVGTFKWYAFIVYDSLSRAAVPVFVMISGILLLDNIKKLDIKKIYTKYIPKMLFLLVLWSVIHSFWRCLYLKMFAFNAKALIKDIITGQIPFWYFSVIIFLYVCTPILRKITKSRDEVLPKYCFLIFLVSSIFITIKEATFLPGSKWINVALDKIYFGNILFWYSYALLGYYIYKTKYLDKYKKLAYIFGCVGLLSCIILTIIASNKSGYTYVEFFDNLGFPVFCMSVALIYLMKNMNPKEKYRKLIENISSTTLGIYLVHMIVFQFIAKVLKIKIYESANIIVIPALTIGVFIISFILVFIYKKVISYIKRFHKKTS